MKHHNASCQFYSLCVHHCNNRAIYTTSGPIPAPHDPCINATTTTWEGMLPLPRQQPGRGHRKCTMPYTLMLPHATTTTTTQEGSSQIHNAPYPHVPPATTTTTREGQLCPPHSSDPLSPTTTWEGFPPKRKVRSSNRPATASCYK